MNEKTDDELIKEYLSGADESLSALIARHLKLVYNFAHRMSGDAAGAEDIAQETFVKVWKNIKRYSLGRNFKTWLLRIARNTAIDWLRARKNPVWSDFENEEGGNILSDTTADSEPLPKELAAKAEDAAFVETLLGRLPANSREIMLLHYVHDLTFDEIGKILDEPLNTVKSRHRRALEKLREYASAPKTSR